MYSFVWIPQYSQKILVELYCEAMRLLFTRLHMITIFIFRS